MDKKLLEQVQERIEEEEDNLKLFTAFDDMDKIQWTPPAGWAARPEMRIRVSTEAHDALKTMANFFDTYRPKWSILPLSEDDSDRAEELEAWLEYFMQKANQNGETYPLHRGLFNSGKFNRTIYHVDYLPYWLPKDKTKWTKEQKWSAKNGPFCITPLDPRCSFYRYGKYGLKWFATVTTLDGEEIIDQWGTYASDSKDGKQIKSGIAKIKSLLENDGDYDFVYVDVTSFDNRLVVAIPTTSEDISAFEKMDFEKDSDSVIVILDSKNELGFIPYAVATGNSDALLHSLHVGGGWVNQNIIDSVVDTSVLKRAFIPPVIHQSQTGKDLDVNFNGDMAAIELGAGESATMTNLPPIDPGLQQLAGINQQRMSKALGISNLGMQDIAGNVQFSTISKQIELQLTNLQPYQRTAEKANVQAALIMFQWIKFTGNTETAYRTPGRVRKDGQAVGQPIPLSPDDFDPDVMQIECKLLSAAPTDKQQMVNMAVTLRQAGDTIPWDEINETLGYSNPTFLKNKFYDEQIEQLALKTFADKQALAVQLEGQAATMQMQMEQQQAQMQAQAQAMPPEQSGAMANPATGDPALANAGGAQNDPNQGGQPPIMAAPGMTREQVRK